MRLAGQDVKRGTFSQRHAALILGVDGTAALLRPTFAIEGVARMYRPARFGAYAFLGLAVSP